MSRSRRLVQGIAMRWISLVLCVAALCEVSGSPPASSGSRIEGGGVPAAGKAISSASDSSASEATAGVMATVGDVRRMTQRESDRTKFEFVSPSPASHWAEIDTEDALGLQGFGEVFVDSRSDGAFGRGHVAGARSIPVGDSDAGHRVEAFVSEFRDLYVPVIVYGDEQRETVGLAESLYGAGLQNVLVCRGVYRDLVTRGFRASLGSEAPTAIRVHELDRRAKGGAAAPVRRPTELIH